MLRRRRRSDVVTGGFSGRASVRFEHDLVAELLRDLHLALNSARQRGTSWPTRPGRCERGEGSRGPRIAVGARLKNRYRDREPVGRGRFTFSDRGRFRQRSAGSSRSDRGRGRRWEGSGFGVGRRRDRGDRCRCRCSCRRRRSRRSRRSRSRSRSRWSLCESRCGSQK